MTTKHDIRFLGALTTLCGLLTLPACATGDEMEPFGELGEAAGDTDAVDEMDENEPIDPDLDDDDDDEPVEPGDDDDDDDEPVEPGDDDDDDDEPVEPGDDDDDEPPMDDPPVDDPPVDEPEIAENDGDFMANPAVYAQFRSTAPAEVSFAEPQFNEDVIDTRGLQYIGEVSVPGDQEDWIQFNIIPGQVDPTITVSLDCGESDLSPQPVRADLLDEQGNVLDTIVCGNEEDVLLDDADGFDDYYVRIEMGDFGEHYDEYTLEIDAFCFQGCDF